MVITTNITRQYLRVSPRLLERGFIPILIFVSMLIFILSIFWIGAGLIAGILILGTKIWRNKKISKQLQTLEEWQVPVKYLDQLQQQLPQSSATQRKWIAEGFKDYLALHMFERTALAMPSYAVDQLWHILLEDPKHYAEICQHLLGRELKHIRYEDESLLASHDQHANLMATWRLSCRLHGFPPDNTETLPRLFAVDFILEIKQDTQNYLSDLKQSYKITNSGNGDGSSCSSCSSCGGD